MPIPNTRLVFTTQQMQSSLYVINSTPLVMTTNKFMYVVMLAGALISLVIVSTFNTNFVHAVGEQFKAKLKGFSEVPPVNTTATGTDRFKVNTDFIRSIINITGIKDVTMAHIHWGQIGQNGEPVVDLLKSADDQSKTDGGMIIKTRIHATDLQGPMNGMTLQDLQTAMGKGQTYVDIHTSDHPQGELRGQIKARSANATDTNSLNATSTALNATSTALNATSTAEK